MSTVEVDDICNMLSDVDSSKAIFVMKDAAEIIAPSIAHIINISIQYGKVPNEFKFAKVIPLYKKVVKLNPVTTYLSQCSASYQKCWKKWFITRFMHIFR